MTKSAQKNLRLDDEMQADLEDVASYEGRTELDVIRTSIAKYTGEVKERRSFIDDVNEAYVRSVECKGPVDASVDVSIYKTMVTDAIARRR